jgi:hypothetical protein
LVIGPANRRQGADFDFSLQPSLDRNRMLIERSNRRP